jgi:hypothetical protein
VPELEDASGLAIQAQSLGQLPKGSSRSFSS